MVYFPRVGGSIPSLATTQNYDLSDSRCYWRPYCIWFISLCALGGMAVFKAVVGTNFLASDLSPITLPPVFQPSPALLAKKGAA